jgi:hypothetical protein
MDREIRSAHGVVDPASPLAGERTKVRGFPTANSFGCLEQTLPLPLSLEQGEATQTRVQQIQPP